MNNKTQIVAFKNSYILVQYYIENGKIFNFDQQVIFPSPKPDPKLNHMAYNNNLFYYTYKISGPCKTNSVIQLRLLCFHH